MRTFLLTGHTGFIGGAVAAALDRRGLDWTGAARSNGVDLRAPDALEAMRSRDVVLHLAGRIGPYESWQDPGSVYRANIDGTLTVCEYARRTGARLVLVSSYMYGVPRRLPIDETHEIACTSPYATSKYLAEQICHAYARDFGVPTTILRPFNVYGPGQPDTQLVGRIIAQALTASRIEIGSLEPKRDFLWLDDLVDAIVRVGLEAESQGVDLFNVGYGASHSVAEVVDLVLAEVGPREIRSDAGRRSDPVMDCVCDASRFRDAYGWAPRVPLRQGIARLIDSSRNSRAPVAS